MDDVEHICHCLCRVVNVALQVYKGRLLFQDAVLISLSYSVNNLVHVSISLTDVHIVADTDDICHEGDHVSSLTDSLAVGYLRFSFVQILNFQT